MKRFILNIRPKAIQSTRFANGHTYVDPKVVMWKREVCKQLLAQKDLDTIQGILFVNVKFYFKRPKSDKNKLLYYYDKHIDLDNLNKGLMDCVTYTECIKDDSKIVKLLLEKFYDDEDRIEIEINDICL